VTKLPIVSGVEVLLKTIADMNLTTKDLDSFVGWNMKNETESHRDDFEQAQLRLSKSSRIDRFSLHEVVVTTVDCLCVVFYQYQRVGWNQRLVKTMFE
jgi:hypothetical protein